MTYFRAVSPGVVERRQIIGSLFFYNGGPFPNARHSFAYIGWFRDRQLVGYEGSPLDDAMAAHYGATKLELRDTEGNCWTWVAE